MNKTFRFRLGFGLLLLASLAVLQKSFARDDRTEVANRIVKMINAADYAGVHKLFNKEMSQALPLKTASDFFAGLAKQYGKIEKLGEPTRKGGWTIFPAHCERGMLDMSLALDGDDQVAGLKFAPRATETKAAITDVADRLVKLINAADYAGVHKLFNKEMGAALPLKTASDFFAGLTKQYGTIEKLGKPAHKGGWTIFPVHCEQGMLDLSLALDDDNKIAGLTFKPAAR